MLQLRVSNIKTQVRRLKYFSVIMDCISKEGIKKELLERKIFDWNIKNNVHRFKKYTGIIQESSKQILSQGFKNYYSAGLQFNLIHNELEKIFFSRKAHVYKIINNELQNIKINDSNCFKLNDFEKLFYLHVIFQYDADIFLTVFNMLKKESGQIIKDYQEKFQDYYKRRLNSKIKYIDSANKYKLFDALNRVKEWKNAKRYSEDIVPPRINWLLDLGLIDENNYFLNKTVFISKLGMIILDNLKIINDDGLLIDIDSDWLESKYMTYSKILFPNKNYEKWVDINENKKNILANEILNLLSIHFRTLDLPRISLEQSILFFIFYLFTKYNIICEYSELLNWIGFDKKIGKRKIGIRKSIREYESYLYIDLN